jgi:ABC-2 type transport system permease protein
MWLRISALMLRHLYLYRRNLARTGEIVFWPVMDLLMWGFLMTYLQRLVVPAAVAYFLGAMIFWDILYRSQQAITLALTEEIWVRNLLNLFITPLTLLELLLALCLLGLVRVVASTVLLSLLAYLLYTFNILNVGVALLPFMANLLLFGWAVGMGTMALVLRFGRAAEALVWGIPFLLQPISAVYYPLDVLPPWLQTLAWLLPSTHVFEGMRTALHLGTVHIGSLLTACGLNLVYLAGGAALFGWMVRHTRGKGYLSRFGMQ